MPGGGDKQQQTNRLLGVVLEAIHKLSLKAKLSLCKKVVDEGPNTALQDVYILEKQS